MTIYEEERPTLHFYCCYCLVNPLCVEGDETIFVTHTNTHTETQAHKTKLVEGVSSVVLCQWFSYRRVV